MGIEIYNRQRRVRWDYKWLKRLAPIALQEAKEGQIKPDAPLAALEEVEVVFISDREISRVHKEFFNDPSVTDVITFDYGEILISADTAARSAAALNLPLEHELALYMVHGLLHLNGHDDLQPNDAKKMHQAQFAILKRCIAACAAVLMAVPLFAQDSARIDAQGMLQTLRDMRQKQKVAKVSERDRIERSLLDAAATPAAAMDFYEQAVMATQFEGKNREHTEFRDWKKREEAKLDDPALKTALQFHLRYLALTISRTAEPDSDAVTEQLLKYIADLLAAPREILDKDFMRQSVAQSPFVRWLALQAYVAPKDWEMSPGQWQSMAEKTLLPKWREKKDPRLLGYWDRQLTMESDQASKSATTFDQNKFNLLRKPVLLWNRSQDLYLLGQQNRAISDMFTLIKTYPSHPDVEKWMDRVESLLSPESNGGAAAAGNEASSSLTQKSL